MPTATALDQASSSEQEPSAIERFSSLRGVRWRIHLGILPNPPSSIDDLRRVAADSRRRYANLRRRLIVDPHLSKDDYRSPDLVMDNPLSQSPGSIWSRYFQNAELEKMLDQDLSRLYPTQESYFQTSTCQTILRRVLLLWCLIRPECGYRQGMHELLAPLLYVLYIDLQYLSHVRGQYEDHFNDEFQGVSLPEADMLSAYRFEKITNRNTGTDRNNSSQEKNAKVKSLVELDPETRDIFLMSDAYGVEGELGIVLSEKFMEHDVYCMFDNLMNDVNGVVAMTEFFSPSPKFGSKTGLPPVIEASSAIYQLLSIVDSSLHTHLVELGVEPQYFVLRWLRVLFGREFSLEDLLIIWDEVFSFPNHFCCPDNADEAHFRCRILCSPRGAYILAMAVSMLLHLRSSLLATDYATACLQRLLNFPEDIDAKNLIVKAKSLQVLAHDLVFSYSPQEGNPGKCHGGRKGHSLSNGSSPFTPIQLSDTYWEEKWRLLHAAEVLKKKSGNTILKEKAKEPVTKGFSHSRTQSDPYPMEIESESSNVGSSSDRKMIQNTDAVKNQDKYGYDEVPGLSATKESPCLEVKGVPYFPEEQTDQNIIRKRSDLAGEIYSSADNMATTTSPLRVFCDREYDSEESTTTSSSLMFDNCDQMNHVEKLYNNRFSKGEITKCDSEIEHESYKSEKRAAALKQRKPLSGRFQWIRKFNRGPDEGTLENRTVEPGKSYDDADPSNNISIVSASAPCCNSCGVQGRTEYGGKNVTKTLRSISKSMLDNIEVIELLLKQNQVADGAGSSRSSIIIGGEGQVVAYAAIEELRKISNFLSEV